MSSTRPPGAPAAVRAATVLRILAAGGGRERTLSELAAGLEAAKSSTLAICTALEGAGLLERGESGYRLGRTTVDLGAAYLQGMDQLRVFYRECARSPVLVEEVVQLAVLDGTEVLYLGRHEGTAPFRFSAGVGSRFPAASTAVGQALLARLDDPVIAQAFSSSEAFPRLTGHSVADLHDLMDAVGRVRRRGHALDREGVHPGVVGVAVSVDPWRSGDAAAALGASLALATADDARVEDVVRELHRLARLLGNPMAESALTVSAR